MRRMRIVQVRSCKNYGVIPVIFILIGKWKFRCRTRHFSRNSNVIPVKYHVDTVIIQVPFFLRMGGSDIHIWYTSSGSKKLYQFWLISLVKHQSLWHQSLLYYLRFPEFDYVSCYQSRLIFVNNIPSNYLN